jgi:hypothetical protein
VLPKYQKQRRPQESPEDHRLHDQRRKHAPRSDGPAGAVRFRLSPIDLRHQLAPLFGVAATLSFNFAVQSGFETAQLLMARIPSIKDHGILRRAGGEVVACLQSSRQWLAR